MKNAPRIGFIGVLDDAPVQVAYAQGWFREEGVAVELSCELGWAALTAKLSSGALTAANVSALYCVASSLSPRGQGANAIEILAMTSYGGLAIVLSSELAALVKGGEMPPSPLRVGVALPRGDSHLALHAWAKKAGVNPNDLTLVPLAATQFVDALAEGYVHGFIGPEPLVSQSEHMGAGAIVARSQEFFPHHPRSAFAVRSATSAQDSEVSDALRRALRRGSAFCGQPENWQTVKAILAEQAKRFGSILGSTTLWDEGLDMLPAGLAFQRPSGSSALDPAGIEFLRRACLATDPGWRDIDVRAAITRVCRGTLEPVAAAVVGK